MTFTRRELGRMLLTVPAAGLLARERLAATFAARPDSKWGGVQVGMNVPYNYGGVRTMPVDQVIAKTTHLGVSAVELRAQPIELALGAPLSMLDPGRDKTAQQQAAEHLRAWRLAVRRAGARPPAAARSEEHTSELQSHSDIVCRLLLEKKKLILV